MTLFIQDPVATPWIDNVGLWRDRVFTVLTLDIVKNLVCSVRLVGKNITLRNINVGKYIDSDLRIVYIAG